MLQGPLFIPEIALGWAVGVWGIRGFGGIQLKKMMLGWRREHRVCPYECEITHLVPDSQRKRDAEEGA